MKKILMTVAAVACAIVANASAVDWSVSVQVKTTGTYTDLTGYSAYLFSASTWETLSSGGAIDLANFSGYLDSAELTVATASTAKTFSTGSTSVQTVSSSLPSSGSYSAYIVLANLTDGGDIWAKSVTPSVYDETADPVPSHTSATWTLAKNNTGAYLTHANAAGTVNVPEPTSGLMLLLGLAGLALKRKRA